MTHQELIERVAEEIQSQSDDWRCKFIELPGFIRDQYRDQAREAIRITGEACAEANKKLVDSALIDIERAGHGCGEDRLVDVMSGVQMSGQAILSLTQGNKT